MQEKHIDLDSLDARILREIVPDGRQPISDLARKLGISQTYARQRFHSLLDRKIARIIAITSPVALGYRTQAVTGIQVASLGDLDAVADKLRSLTQVKLLMISAGWQDIIIWAVFANATDLSAFLATELGNIPGIKSSETMMVMESRVSWTYLPSSLMANGLSVPPPPADLVVEDSRARDATLAQKGHQDSDIGIDQLDLMILREMEQDGRQPVSHLAKKLGICRPNARARLQRLLDQQITRIITFTNPAHLGYPVFTMIGIKVSPKEIDAVMDKIETLSNVYWVARVAGRYDLIANTLFRSLTELSVFLARELGATPGVLSAETMISLEVRKWSFAYLASSHLRNMEKTG
jgi:DNA-binding Lrp family transcriptional regulator